MMISIWMYSLSQFFEDLQVDYFNPEHTYSLKFLLRPLHCKEMGDITRALGITHSGLGIFDDQDQTFEWVLSYNKKPTGYDKNDTDDYYPNMIWNEQTQLYQFQWRYIYAMFGDDDYKTDKCNWEQQINVASQLKGNVVNELLHTFVQDFQNKYNETYNMYEAWYEGKDRDRWGTPPLHSQQCHDAIWWSLQHMSKICPDIKWNTNVLIPRMYAYYVIHKDEDVRWLNESDPIDNNIIFKYYEEIRERYELINDPILFRTLWITGEYWSYFDNFELKPYSLIFLNDGKYYLLTTDKIPWFESSDQIVPGTD